MVKRASFTESLDIPPFLNNFQPLPKMQNKIFLPLKAMLAQRESLLWVASTTPEQLLDGDESDESLIAFAIPKISFPQLI